MKNIPFIQLLDINDDISLDFKNIITNHINSIHAGALFTLAETKSGNYLNQIFKDYDNEVLALLRESKVKYKKIAKSKIYSFASINKDEKKKFLEIMKRRKKAIINISVTLKDEEDDIVFIGIFTWYIQDK